MGPTIKKLWINGLRSGEYVQGKEELCTLPLGRGDPTKYCCLGVLARVTGMTNVQIEALENDGERNTYLSEDKLEELGLDHDQQVKLSEKNDHGESFEAIARYIEEQL